MKSILLLENETPPAAADNLRRCCKSLHRAASEGEARAAVGAADAVVLHVPAAALAGWQSAVAGMRRLPTLWLCPDGDVPPDVDWGYTLDGILFATMGARETKIALQWGVRTFQQRRRWAEEREQLLQRIEERKWIDQAKAVLCEVKGITEAEAYDFLRKQAMNERKRIGDISASIVKVYQLIHG
ncbi:ANTAR domain-containing response regulator [Paenibacillus sp. GCM10023250]|uniref:ANTAR domain-containing response regulator n=1 Tax=Paenibacillus sp. GCM10023250 TaxID=3252648 RepID=UPI00361A4F05